MPRSRSFDEDELLDAAIELFWAGGYRASSLVDLSAATGVANGSLYQAWGSKWALFLAAFRRYCDRRVVLVEDALSGERDPERMLRQLFDAIVDDCRSRPDRRGCLLVNTVSELGTDPDVAEIARSTTAAMEAGVARELARLTGQSPDAAEVADAAAHAIALSQALIQLDRVGRPEAEVRAIARHGASTLAQSLRAA
ncbi:TetR/AcrR family transcriptional regulator [Microbacterium ureisolvens]|uniref:TetR/AcrR family transcriptional regulator n=1 Tax=Microbacterium ureisolvens TaxID=2781186 RepID=A0ABS7HZ83_9MICO|nr:TetR/AcrR family transcriptional regulator [Microbacterium ureisolvens]MBW9110707.1 TetR/AcrR family transcriptional regulator [Microbacterium ureisolvens]